MIGRATCHIQNAFLQFCLVFLQLWPKLRTYRTSSHATKCGVSGFLIHLPTALSGLLLPPESTLDSSTEHTEFGV